MPTPPQVDRATSRPDAAPHPVPRRSVVTDVVIVGGGPAGAAAAIELARSGRDCVVVDKAVFPRDKCCGDGLTTLALRELEHLGVDPGRIDDWQHVDGATLRSPSGREVVVPLPDDGAFAAVAPRLQLDAAILDRARAEGALVLDGHAFRSIRQDDHRTGDDHDTAGADEGADDGIVTVVVDGPDGEVELVARYVVAADGMWSPVRKAVGVHEPGYLGEWHGFRQYVGRVTGPAAHQLFVWFEPDLVPGYAWSFPLPGGRANVGFGVLRDGTRSGRQTKALWDDLRTRPHVVAALGPDAEYEDRHTAWPIPARIDRLELSAGRVLFVGDAAAATDVMTGEGIGQALLTGRLAAEAVVAAGALRPDVARSRYEREVHHHLVADHRMSASLGKVLATDWGARGAIRVVAASGEWGRRNFARWMFEDEPRAVLLTPSRWHRRFLARPGAYRSA